MGLNYSEVLAVHECPTCGVVHAFPRTLEAQMSKDRGPNGKSVRCPNGHSWYFTGKTDEEREREKRAAAERREMDARNEAEQARKMRSIAERTCPWPTCEGRRLRTTKKLREHMVEVHGAPWLSPSLEADEVAQVLNGRDQVDVVK